MGDGYGYDIGDLERSVFASLVSQAQSLTEMRLKEILRGIGQGVGHGRKYHWSSLTELGDAVEDVRDELARQQLHGGND